MGVDFLCLFRFTIAVKRFNTLYCQKMNAFINGGVHTSIRASIKTITGIWGWHDSEKVFWAPSIIYNA